MTAISNGFCVLNTAACAALYATTPVSEGGPGLRRVCVIDFDVHHGNGTQDILCSTYDPRFLYISLHAGGAHINGYEDKDAEEQELDTLGSKRQEGIYPGRSGDSSPHLGVVNIPLGARVTSIGVGGAMVDVVRPAVDAFSPDLIILSAGFDAHKNDPLGLGGMTAEDFGTLTDVVCKLALRICSGRVLSVLEGGYGIPCCGIQENTFLPSNLKQPMSDENVTSESEDNVAANDGQPAEQQPVTQAAKQSRLPGSETQPKILELGEDLPPGMRDEVPANLQRRLEKCHSEGFIDCVRHHVQSLVNCNARSE
jgi:acetoin utilization deacetylase AcuC-like enzyme